ncbi:unnamed protein product [Malus baccata var. baccata]
MDNSWLTIPRNFEAYTAGINLFLDQAVANDYKNACWRHHGEQNIGEQNVAIGEEETGDDVIGMHDFLNDVFVQPLTEEGVGPSNEPSIGEGRPEEVETFFRLLEEADQDLWPDSPAWKHLDNLYPDFATEIRNVRLGLASDGFNPFGKMRNDHSTWPVVLSVYNLPPWMCMKQPNLLLSLLIPGLRSPGKEIDVYMRPLIDELNELWEKNIHDSVVGTLLGIEKSKDGLAARADLEVLNIRRSQHPRREGNRTFLPPALFTLKREEKTAFCNVLSTIRVPDGYSSNVSRCVHVNERKIHGLKSHDCHVLMQQLLPLAIRPVLPKAVTMVLLELSAIFRQLCIHLADEAALAGPIPYRWMYPIERYLQTLKRYVRNKGRPEGEHVELDLNALDQCHRYILNNCDEVNPFRSESPRGMKTDQYGFTMVNFNQLGFKEDPFILASQALQAFYVEDTIEKDWHVVVRTQPRDLFDVLEDSDAIDDYAIPNLDDRILDNENFHTRVGVEETHFLESLALPTEFVNHANVDDELTDDDGE